MVFSSLLLPPMLRWWHYTLAFLVGATLVFAFAPFAQRWVAWLVPLLFFWLQLPKMRFKQRLWLCWLFGIGVFAGGTHWIYVSIHYFGGANSVIAALMVLVFVVIVGSMLMLFALFSHYLQDMPLAPKLLIAYPAIWWWVEWVRGWLVLGGFPWLQLGQSQIDTWLVGYAPIIGSLGISWVVALGAGALLLMVLGDNKQRIIAALVLFLSLQLGWLLRGAVWTAPTGERLYVSMIQGNLSQEDKWKPELRDPHVQKQMDMTMENISNSNVVIWAETALPDFFQRSMEDVVYPLQEAAIADDTELLIGGFYREEGKNETYNAVLRIGEDLDVYGKRRLVPFSEYIPLLKYLRWMSSFIRLPYDNVSPWQGGVNLNVAGQPMRISICYEDAYGEEMIQGLPEATMLVNVSNDGWFTGSIEPAQHAEIARMRAVETGRYLLRATNNGESAIINVHGEVIATAPQDEEAIIAGYAQPMMGSTPYIYWGNYLMTISMSGILLLLGVLIWRQKRQQVTSAIS